MSARRVADAKVMLTRYADVLAGIEAKTGVPKEMLVAIWGMETDYGSSMGDYNLFATLATQAYRGPRQQYARREFLAALKLLQQENYPVSEMTSSWAGAFGQTQFMPSTFFKYATDGDGDGKIDLWSSPADALASTAALFANEGWQTGKPWGYEVKLPRISISAWPIWTTTGRCRTGRRWGSRLLAARRSPRARSRLALSAGRGARPGASCCSRISASS